MINWNENKTTSTHNHSASAIYNRHRIGRIAAAAIISSSMLLTLLPVSALADTQSELDAKVVEVEQMSQQISDAEKAIEEQQKQIDDLSSQITEAQERSSYLQQQVCSTLKGEYKQGTPNMLDIIVSSSSLDEMTTRIHYLNKYTDTTSALIDETNELQGQLQQQYDDVSAQKDAQQAELDDMNTKKEKLDETVSELKEKLADEQAQARISAAQSSAAVSTQKVASTFSTGDTSGWSTGVASAYGGSSDASTGAVAHTATGAICNDWSMGVAVPMAWPNYRSLLGRKVEISYGGQSVIATVNDCGGMGGGARSLDLQPGVFKAFGFSTCQAWGIRTVSYRFL